MPEVWIRALEDILIPLAGMGMLTLLGLGVYRTIHRVMDRRQLTEASGELEDVRDALADLHEEVQAIHAQSARELGELHERLDFAERLLVQPASEATPTPS